MVNKEELHRIFKNIKNNNELEFNNLCKNYKDIIYGVAFSILKNKEDSEEITQIVFMKIYEMEKDKLPNKNEASWLYTLTKNETISLLRHKKDIASIETIYEIEEENNEIDKIIDKIEFNKLISKLNDKEKEIVSLKVISNLSFNEISKLLNEPIGTIKWRYYKALNVLTILITNIGAFILTFIIGIKTLFNSNKKISENIEEDKSEEENKENNRVQDDDNKKVNEILKEEATDKKELENNTIQKSDVEEIINSSTNYLGIGVLCFSAFFLIITIIISIFLKKYQLKLKKKPSK